VSAEIPAVLAALPGRFPAHAERLARILAESTGTPMASLKGWMRMHHGEQVCTLQVNLDGTAPWCPGPRTVDAYSRASYLLLDGSRRDYAGTRVVSASAHGVIVVTDSQAVAYVLADVLGAAA
jgi:hypothetical protein